MQWDLVKILNENESADWKQLAAEELGTTVHSDRLMGYCLAREALRLCLRKKSLSLSVPELKVQNYQYLTAHPELILSLSHTKEAGAAVVGSSLVYRSVGIDIEPETRVVKDTIAERIANKNDLSLEKIKLWCVKEAAFKALMNTGDFLKNIEFSDIQISATTFTHSPSGLKGEWDLQTLTPFVLAKAWIYKQNF
jgi:phosphopantetheinyl transferase